MRFRRTVLPVTQSTNNEIKAAIDRGEPEGLTVRALRQEGGYGRQGRRWSSPEGGLYLSILLRPDVEPARLPTLSLAAGVAVRKALASSVCNGQAARLALKWPNDVVVLSEVSERESALAEPFMKICGISVEKHRDGVCLGIGANVLPPAPEDVLGAHPADGGNRAVYLSDLGFGFICDRQACVAEVEDAVLRELERCYGLWRAGGFAALEDEYRESDALLGRPIAIGNIHGDITVEGTAAGVCPDGSLLVKEKGTEKSISVPSGEAHVMRRR